MQFVEHHIAQVAEEALRLLAGNQQCHLFRRGEQNVGRAQFLPLALGNRRIARAVLDGDGKPHLLDGLAEIALDIDRQRLQRRDIERVDALIGRARRQLATRHQIGQRWQETGERLAGTGGGDQQGAFATPGTGEQFQLMGTGLPPLASEPAREGGRQKGKG